MARSLWNQLAVSLRRDTELPRDAAASHLASPPGKQNMLPHVACPRKSAAASFTGAPKWTPECPSLIEWLDERGLTSPVQMECYLATKTLPDNDLIPWYPVQQHAEWKKPVTKDHALGVDRSRGSRGNGEGLTATGRDAGDVGGTELT